MASFGQAVSKISLAPSMVAGGAASVGTVKLSSKAGADGAVVTLSSSNVAATVPASVTVPGGATSTSFAVSTSAVLTSTTAIIKGKLGTGTASATLSINAPKLSSLTFTPSTVAGGSSTQGTVKLSSNAPQGGIVVNLKSSSSAWGGPASAKVPGGSSTVSFDCTTATVATNVTATVTAKISGSSVTGTLSIKSATLASLVLQPSTVGGGASGTGTVTLNGKASTGGLKVSLKSASKVATVPSTVTIPANASTATFSFSTTSVTKSTSAKITASIGSASSSQTLTINPLALAGLTIAPTSVIGGSGSTGTVTLNAPAPAQGLSVSLSSNQPVAKVLGNVSVAPGESTATFQITTSQVATSTSATISANLLSATFSATLTVNPPPIASFTLSPTSVLGGSSSTGTVTLSTPAPNGGVSIGVTSSQGAATVPGTVTVPAGSTSAIFTVTTQPVGSITNAVITASLSSSSIGLTLTINPPTLVGVTFAPATVIGGATSTGTVTLSGPAPSSGLTLGITSDQAAAPVPTTVTVASGSKTGTFSVVTKSVNGQTVAHITITDPSGNPITASLTINSQAATSVQIVNVAVNEITFDPVSGYIWATVQSSASQYANNLIAINPSTGVVVKTINMGAQPGHVSVTDDGHYAYMDFPSDGSIRRADLVLGKVDAIFPDGIGGVFDVKAVPGLPHSYVVVTDPVYGENTTIWDDGVRRPGKVAGGYAVHFAGSNNQLMYGDGQPSFFTDNVTTMTWSQTGIPVNGCQWANGLLYTAVPTVVDPVNKYVVQSIPTTNFLVDKLVSVSTADQRIYYVTWDSQHNKRLLSFDINTYNEAPWFDTGNIPGGCHSMVACGNHTVAFFIFGYNVTQNVVIVRNLK